MEMPVFIVLGQFTQKGIENMKASPERLEAARKVARSVGGEIKEFYYTMGRYDLRLCENLFGFNGRVHVRESSGQHG